MKSAWKLSVLVLLVLVFTYSCTKGNTNPSYVFKKSGGAGAAAEVGELKISKDELMKGLESEIYEQEMKIFEIKFNKLQSLLVEKLIKKDPKSKGMTNEEYLEKNIVSSIKISDKEINEFIKERKIPKQHINKDLKDKIVAFLKENKKKEAIEQWVAKQTSGKDIKVYFEKPRRPTFNVKGGDSPAKGPADAKVEIVEFSDFQCPYCSRAVEVITAIEKKYGNKVRIVFKQYPLPFHNQAKTAAVASLCAHEQGKFWQMHDAMFENQGKLAPKDLKASAKKIGVKTEQFDKCLDSNKYLKTVESEIEYGSKIGVKSTPTFFVNGQLVSGAQPIEVFSEIIDEELKK